MKPSADKIAVLGAGSWGMALSNLFCENGKHVRLWEYLPDRAKRLAEQRRDEAFLRGVTLADEILITNDVEEAVEDAELVALVVPSHAMRQVCRTLNSIRLAENTIVSMSKGLENETLMRMSEVILDTLDEELDNNVAVLSGPSHAEEVSVGLPTTVVVSSGEPDVSSYVQRTVMTPRFRIYTSLDVIGVEMGGAVKNIIAIAAGVCDGLGFGDNTKAALLTRGLAEISRLGVAMGANPLTFAGLAGMGDLIVTCTSHHSRNRNLGERIGRGATLEQAMKQSVMVAEGVKTTIAAHELAKRVRVEMPITEKVKSVLFEGEDPRAAVSALMERHARSELESDFLSMR
jgi:glycerol-3-phosphate dehydrogenase (NAD(P)+)